MLDKTYSPRALEARWYRFWMERGYFRADEHSEKEPFCIVIPPPNVTGKLHMGHALFVTIQDLMTRYKRMQGFEALWLPGTDHAGIATQVMVERSLAAEGKTRLELGREEFLKRVWAWKEEKGSKIMDQLKILGASCDWSRMRFTMDEGSCEAVVEAFVRLYEDGLIYREERLVNWDPVTKTVLSDLEIEQEEEEGSLWHIRYDLVDGSASIIIATTRPETLFGDTAVAVHPEDERYRGLIGKLVKLPLTERQIPIIADAEAADPAFGSGAVKITPAHDFNDFACGQRNHLPRVRVIDMDARMSSEVPSAYVGLSREACRKAVVEALEASGQLIKVEAHRYAPSRSQRSGAIVEPLLLPQWWVDAQSLAKPAIESVEAGTTTMTPKLWEKTFFNWMHNIRDWCISRQLWWGHQIPAWYCEDCNREAISRFYREGARDPELHISREAKAIVARQCPERCDCCGGHQFIQDPDVLDTWFSSGLWPFSTLGWPQHTASLDKFYPTSFMETGADIIFFWVARMMMFGFHFLGQTPFKDIYFHALVRDKFGQKMSKTKGNVIDPLLLIDGCTPESIPADERAASTQLFEEYPQGIEAQGADALRFSLTMLAAQGRDVRLDIRRIEGYRAFLNKVWQASRFVLIQVEAPENAALVASLQAKAYGQAPSGSLDPASAWILDGLMQCIQRSSDAIERYDFSTAAQEIYDFLWNAYCDWYIELSKVSLYAKSSEADAQKESVLQTLLFVLENLLRLLHPFAPFVTEEIWQALPKGTGAPESIMIAPWPKATADFENEIARFSVSCLIALVSSLRQIRGESNLAPSKAIPKVYLQGQGPALEAMLAGVPAICTLARVETIEALPADADKPKPAAIAVAQNVEVIVPFAGLIDIDEERLRLDKNIAKLEKELAASLKKLENPSFIERAKPEVVASERERVQNHRQALQQIQRARAQLEL